MGRPAMKVALKVSSAAQTYYIQVPPVQYPNYNYSYVWPYNPYGNVTTTTTVAPTYRPTYVPSQQYPYSGIPQVVNCSGMSCYALLPLVPDWYSQSVPYYSWGWRNWAARYWSACAWFMC
ncbi:uncharacterized protein LOC124356625 [Homalodisca vitripennis]|uniref:uncharacterized protein LOC124356625 n=1 Tax=Homalodisca vitripennis TaxID=197043 RepID=UPI001EEC5336|nr:uncharacterized protein LOC124356625 [Homalodisca vitripennis]XP_046663695.1 uncharacterized protein LOC124356625 [Homalodisca vitripennis]